MEKKIFSLFLIVGLSLSINTQSFAQGKKIKILRVDSTKEYYVFHTNSKSKEYSIVIAEKQKLSGCGNYLKKLLLADSIKESPYIKIGSKKLQIGDDELIIDNVKVKNADVLVKLINNCGAFSD